jgi:hypothetical protein
MSRYEIGAYVGKARELALTREFVLSVTARTGVRLVTRFLTAPRRLREENEQLRGEGVGSIDPQP